MLKNTANQYESIQMTSRENGAPLTTGTVSVYYTGDDDNQTACTNVAAHKGNGEWRILLTQGETNYDCLALTWVHDTGVNITQSYRPVQLRWFGIKEDLQTAQAYSQNHVTLVNGTTLKPGDYITGEDATTGAGYSTQIANMDTSIATAYVATIDPPFPEITGTLTYTGRVGSGNPQTYVAKADMVKLNNTPQSAGTDLGTEVPAIAEAVEGIPDVPFEGSYTFRQLVRGMAAVLFGKSTVTEASSTTDQSVYRSVDDTTDRVTSVSKNDGKGQRNTVTSSLS
jgi:hypothetical protein